MYGDGDKRLGSIRTDSYCWALHQAHLWCVGMCQQYLQAQEPLNRDTEVHIADCAFGCGSVFRDEHDATLQLYVCISQGG